MKKYFLLLVTICCLLNELSAQQWKWGKTVPGYYGGFMGSDSSSNIYTGTGPTGDNFQIRKMDSLGTLIWTKVISPCYVYDMEVGKGRIVISGYFSSTLTLGSTTLISGDIQDGFIASFDLNANLQWVRHLSGTGPNAISTIELNDNDEVFLSAFNEANSSFCGHSFSKGCMIAVLDDNGALTDKIHIPMYSSEQRISSLAIDKEDNIYVLGTFADTLLQIDTITLTGASYHNSKYFLSKFKRSGEVYWAKNFGGVFKRHLRNLCVNKSHQIYLTEHSNYEEDLLHKISSTGNILSSTIFGGEMYGAINDLKIDDENNLYATGSTWQYCSFGSCQLQGSHDFLYIVKADSTGNCIWALKGQSNTSSGGLRLSIKNSKIFMTGYSKENAVIKLDNISVAGTFFIARIGSTAVTRVPEVAAELNQTIFPNPTQGLINLPGTQLNTSLKVYNATGCCVLCATPTGSNNTLDIRGLPKGIYFLETQTPSKKTVQKIILE
jgi:hypothetical protein